jgi:hypothetical protein
MLIVNNKILTSLNDKSSELYEYAREYDSCIKDLNNRFPSGTITLQRNGYPKINKNPNGIATLPEIAAPIFINLTTSVKGVSWGYCKGAPTKHANGLVDVPDSVKTAEIKGEILVLNLKDEPDYTFFIMYKSKLLGSMFHIFDPEGDKIKELEEKNAKLKVQYAIRESMDEEKLKTMCNAYGIKKVNEKNILILQEELENIVFKQEEEKKKNPTNLMLRGVVEFLGEIKNDDITRPKAVIQNAIESEVLSFNKSQGKYFFDGDELCHVPFSRYEDKQVYVMEYLQRPENAEKWRNVILKTIKKEDIEKMEKYGLRWLATQVDIPLNQKPEDLAKTLLEMFI